jgi:hypothetical protein
MLASSCLWPLIDFSDLSTLDELSLWALVHSKNTNPFTLTKTLSSAFFIPISFIYFPFVLWSSQLPLSQCHSTHVNELSTTWWQQVFLGRKQWIKLEVVLFKTKHGWGASGSNCSPSYSGGRDQEDCSLKPTWANSLLNSISTKSITKKGMGSGSRCRPWVQIPVPQKQKKRKRKHTSTIGGGDTLSIGPLNFEKKV